MSLNSKVIMSFLAGLFSAALAWIVIDFNGLHRIPDSFGGDPMQMFREQAFLGAVFGLFIGVAIAGVNGLSSGSTKQLKRDVGWGAVVGLVGGVVGLYIGQMIFGPLYKDPRQALGFSALGPIWFVWDVIIRAIGWGVIGLIIGLVQGLPSKSPQAARHGAIGGLIGGLLGGSLFEISQYIIPPGVKNPSVICRGIGLIVTGASIGLFIGLVETLLKQAWIRVVVGRNEGKEYVVSKQRTVIGRDELADIGLFGDLTIAPYHAAIEVQNGRRVLVDGGSQFGTSVNNQRVSSQVLRDGDVIQIASMRLEFHEKATASIVAPPADYAKPSIQIPQTAGICPFCGTKKDASGGCACSVGSQPQPPQQPAWQQPVVPQPTMQASSPGAQQTIGMAAVPTQGSGPRLVGMAGAYSGQVFPLSPTGSTMVGREPNRDVQLAMDSTVSRLHARIENEGGAFVVYDEGSSNGTTVNGARITRQQISPGDVVGFGSSSFRFEG